MQVPVFEIRDSARWNLICHYIYTPANDNGSDMSMINRSSKVVRRKKGCKTVIFAVSVESQIQMALAQSKARITGQAKS